MLINRLGVKSGKAAVPVRETEQTEKMNFINTPIYKIPHMIEINGGNTFYPNRFNF